MGTITNINDVGIGDTIGYNSIYNGVADKNGRVIGIHTDSKGNPNGYWCIFDNGEFNNRPTWVELEKAFVVKLAETNDEVIEAYKLYNKHRDKQFWV